MSLPINNNSGSPSEPSPPGRGQGEGFFSRSLAPMLAIATMLLFIPACSYNEETAFINCVDCPAALDADTVSLLSDQPSVQSLNRSDWELYTIAVPLRQVEHPTAPLRARNWFSDTPHQRGEYPTAVTAIDTAGDSGTAAFEGVINIVGIPVSWAFTKIDTTFDESGPFGTDRSTRDDESFHRLPQREWDYQHRWIAVK